MRRLHQGFAIGLALMLAAAAAACGDNDGGDDGPGGSPTGGTGAGGDGGAGTTTGTGGAGTGGMGGATTSTGSSMGTPCNGNTCDLIIQGQGFAPHDGQTVYAGIVPQGSQDGFVWSSSAVVQGGAFTMMGPGALEKGLVYDLNYYADINGNGACDPAPTDHVWRTSLPPVQENLTVTLVHDTNFANLGCGGF